MADLLYKKLYDITILKKAWHLARSDTRTDFIQDPFKHNDFAFNLDKNLQAIATALKDDRYHPNPLLCIDIPKSTLSVRPGSITSIEDRIVLFAITMLIAPKLDKKLPETVYSYRLKEKFDNNSLFKDLEILKFPFLKRKTIRQQIDIVEPWYGQWPKFIEKTIYTFEKEGYRFLTVSDISAYFENINLRILRDNLLKYLPKEQKIINLLYSLLEYWTWPTVHGLSIERGIPQGNDVSSFIGNIYLLPLDEEFKKFSKRKDIRYFRYMDDVKIFSKEEDIAREVIFLMNEVLRKLHLNIQGTKTIILEGEDVRSELVDDRLDNVNNVIKDIQNNLRSITNDKRQEYLDKLKRQYKKIKRKNKIIQNKDLRLYRRLITGFTLLDSSYMVESLLKQLPKNPDSRLLDKAVSYLKNFPRKHKKIEESLLNFLESSINLFPYQEARMIELLRYLKSISRRSINYSKRCLKLKNKHWYVKVQSALLLSCVSLQKKEIKSLKKIYENEKNVELKRALVKGLCQLQKDELDEFLRVLVFENDKKLSSIGRMLLSIRYNQKNTAINEISNMFRQFNEEVLLDGYYKIEIIKFCDKQEVRKSLLKRLKAVKRAIKREHLLNKINKTIELLQVQN